MIFAVILMSIVAIALLVIGYLIWRREKISLLHDYHYDKIRDEDKTAFCTLSGLGVIAIGTGLLITAVWFAIAESALAFLALAIGFAAGLSLLIYATRKYNR